MNISSRHRLCLHKTTMSSFVFRIILYDLPTQKRLFNLDRVDTSSGSPFQCMQFKLIISFFYLFFDPVYIHNSNLMENYRWEVGNNAFLLIFPDVPTQDE